MNGWSMMAELEDGVNGIGYISSDEVECEKPKTCEPLSLRAKNMVPVIQVLVFFGSTYVISITVIDYHSLLYAVIAYLHWNVFFIIVIDTNK